MHVIGPEQGLTLPGTTIVCGDSHTCTHGALGAIAWGITPEQAIPLDGRVPLPAQEPDARWHRA